MQPSLKTQEGAQDEATVKNEMLKPVVFWGICDIKYNPELAELERIKVLELGDGRSSRFSHHGEHIKVKFDSEYVMDPNPIKRAVLVDNKKFTHDMFVQSGFHHLRPQQCCYPRRYETDLAARIASDLHAEQDGAVVLKLVNRARGAGVVVCPVAQLDNILQQLLLPPSAEQLDKWFMEQMPGAVDRAFSQDIVHEQKLHYWSNECPLFVAENVCHSMLVGLPNSDANLQFDGTLRVAFALCRQERSDAFKVEWLGGYWKLPPESSATEGNDTLEALHGRIVSSFNSEEKRTAEVAQEHLQEIYGALTPALPQIFRLGNMGVQSINSSYPNDPNFKAYALARAAAALRASDLNKATFVLEQARKLVKVDNVCDDSNLPERSVMSYLERHLGVGFALQKNWDKASVLFQAALDKLPTNASAWYLKGMAYQDKSKYDMAINCHLKSVALDPDFRSPFMALGECYCFVRRYHDAIAACKACLRRQPDAPVAQYYIGQAMYQLLHDVWKGTEAEAVEMRVQALHALRVAQQGMPQLWTDSDDLMCQYLRSAPAVRKKVPRQEVKSWRVVGWRP